MIIKHLSLDELELRASQVKERITLIERTLKKDPLLIFDRRVCLATLRDLYSYYDGLTLQIEQSGLLEESAT